MKSDQHIKWRTVQHRQKEKAAHFRQYKERQHHLQRLKQMLVNHEGKWLEALRKDLRKPPMEGYASEIAVLLHEIEYALKHLQEWMKSDTSRRFLAGGVEKTCVRRSPYGSVLIISPWNYPLQLALMPLIGALAAGNSCFIKPSEYAGATSKLLSHLIGRYFPREVVTVVEGDAEVAQQLLELEWDFIFFTGSKRVGKIIHQQAAERTIPVVLELGGKNPCIVDETGMSEANVRRIIWGKFLNAGQSCIAPDTVYVHKSIFPQFLKMAKTMIREFYGPQPENSKDYGRIISVDHFNRITQYLTDGNVYVGGRYSRKKLFLEPTILIDLDQTSDLQREEIFGPILPIVPYADLTNLLDNLHEMPSPLVTYFFSESEEPARHVAHRVRSGAFSYNQVIRHAASPHIPFGGVGASGFGRYHGKASFEAFSYQKAGYTQRTWGNSSLQYPPYQNNQMKWLRRLRKWFF